MRSSFWQITLLSDSNQIEPLTETLWQLGASAVTYQENGGPAVLEPDPNTQPLWQQLEVVGLFENEVAVDRVMQSLSQQGWLREPTYSVTSLIDQAWERCWLEHFQPIHCGGKLWICPSWCEPPDPHAVNIKLDPGLAFGTGTHETTKLCLEWLAQQAFVGNRIIDYGCGSGILAIAALRLGAAEVWAIDHDPQALQATQQNAEQNHIDLTRLHVRSPPPALPQNIDLVLANILAGPLITLAPHLSACVRSGGYLVLSGILQEQSDEVAQAYTPFCRVHDIQERNGWMRLVMERL